MLIERGLNGLNGLTRIWNRLRVMRYALCVMRYALCVKSYALRVMRYALCVMRQLTTANSQLSPSLHPSISQPTDNCQLTTLRCLLPPSLHPSISQSPLLHFSNRLSTDNSQLSASSQSYRQKPLIYLNCHLKRIHI